MIRFLIPSFVLSGLASVALSGADSGTTPMPEPTPLPHTKSSDIEPSTIPAGQRSDREATGIGGGKVGDGGSSTRAYLRENSQPTATEPLPTTPGNRGSNDMNTALPGNPNAPAAPSNQPDPAAEGAQGQAQRGGAGNGIAPK